MGYALEFRRLTVPCSIGGVIGTGLFLGTAGSLQNGGPIGLLLGYATVGTICYAVYVLSLLVCVVLD